LFDNLLPRGRDDGLWWLLTPLASRTTPGTRKSWWRRTTMAYQRRLAAAASNLANLMMFITRNRMC
jgi:hypothetical protein